MHHQQKQYFPEIKLYIIKLVIYVNLKCITLEKAATQKQKASLWLPETYHGVRVHINNKMTCGNFKEEGRAFHIFIMGANEPDEDY